MKDDVRIVGMRFDRLTMFDKHVDYWLVRGLRIRAQINAVEWVFGSEGGINAWKVMRLVQGAYLPVVEFGLEWVMMSPTAMKKIQVHINDTIRSLCRMPFKLANNILLAETGIPPVHLRALYIRWRAAARALNHGYCNDHPWFMDVRRSWIPDGMVAIP